MTVTTTQAPLEVRQKLESIDPNARLIRLGGNTWWLGIDAPNPAAHERLLKVLQGKDTSPYELEDPAERALALEEVAKEHVMHQIMAYGLEGGRGGFRPVELRECAMLNELHELVKDFEIADSKWRRMGFRAYDEIRKAGEKGKLWFDRIRQDARSWWRHFMSRRGATIINPWGKRKGPAAED